MFVNVYRSRNEAGTKIFGPIGPFSKCYKSQILSRKLGRRLPAGQEKIRNFGLVNKAFLFVRSTISELQTHFFLALRAADPLFTSPKPQIFLALRAAYSLFTSPDGSDPYSRVHLRPTPHPPPYRGPLNIPEHVPRWKKCPMAESHGFATLAKSTVVHLKLDAETFRYSFYL